jgi:hypothetical protein
MSEWKRRAKYDIETQHIQALSQKLASRFPELQDYAMNLNADKIAKIDVMLKLYQDDSETVEFLKGLRETLLMQGIALWIMNADVLTNLGLKLGKTGIREVKGKIEDV